MAQVKNGRPGHRFQDYHEKARRSGKQGKALGRVVRITLAVLAIAIGGLLTVLPGPAILFFFIAGALLATESKIVARGMDWLEVKLRAVWDWGQKHWRRLPTIGRVAVIALMAGLSVAGAVIFYRVLRG